MGWRGGGRTAALTYLTSCSLLCRMNDRMNLHASPMLQHANMYFQMSADTEVYPPSTPDEEPCVGILTASEENRTTWRS